MFPKTIKSKLSVCTREPDNLKPDNSEPSGDNDTAEEKTSEKKQSQELEDVEKKTDEPGVEEDSDDDMSDEEELTLHGSDSGQDDNGQDDNGQDDNGQDDNGQDDNGQDDNGQDDNGQDDNGQDDNGQDDNDYVSSFIEKGSPLARIIPGKEGKSGKDVLGYPIKPAKPSICVLNAGSGVIKKGDVFLAQISGRPVLKNGTTLVVEAVPVKGEIKSIIDSINNDTKDTYESAIVELTGAITSAAILRCHSLRLNGSLMGKVICTGEINVNGDIGSEKKPEDKDIPYQTDIICQGSIKVSKSIINSKIQTGGELLAFNSTVVGSEVIAYNGMVIRGSLAGKNAPSIFRFGLKPGDKILTLDHTIEKKNMELSLLKKEDDIAKLTEKYRKDLNEEENYLFEQAILKNLIEMIEAPELYQYEGLENKVKYLYGLPDFSSVKAYYLKIPETKAALEFLDQILTSIAKMSLENVLKYLTKKIDPEPDDENTVSNTHRIESNFKAGLAGFEQEIADKSEEIKKLENEIKGLEALRVKLESIHVNFPVQSGAVIKIKNKCEKGTIIKGKIARFVVEKTMYNVKFKEVMSPITKVVSIIIETC
ncbi:MAG: DUF342 domain-containing protein [Desulfobacteraceae bacterium]|nr:DUF342 domain-containing protein [Desulfobacteraceae bacterium]